MERLNAWLVGEGLGEPFSFGVGLHTGPVVCGNVGSARRLAYTAIGDTSNTASRVEGLTRETGRSLLLTEDTRAALTRPAPPLVELGAHHIRGRRATVTLWGLAAEQRGAQARDEQSSAPGERLRA
jgi:adenylate cyclase